MNQPSQYPAKSMYTEEVSQAYQQRHPARHHKEIRLIDMAMGMVPKSHTILDLPCGGGRVFTHLAQLGYKVAAADYSDSMLEIARENAKKAHVECVVEKQDIENLTYPDKVFDSIICFRLFHHFPSARIRQKAASELCRVSREYVLVSYFSKYSWTHLRLKINHWLGRKQNREYANSLSEIAGYFAAQGFVLVKDCSLFPVGQRLHLAVFKRK